MRFPHAFRVFALAVVLGGTSLLAVAPAASAHWIHEGCNPPALWADAYVAQLTHDPTMTITWHDIGPVDVPIIDLHIGDPYSAIICIPDNPLSPRPPFDMRDILP